MQTNQWGCGKDSVVFSHGTSNSKGVLTAFRESHCNANGRYTILDLEIDNCPFILINYHAPNDECQQFQVLEEISNNLDKLDLKENTQFIWGGDFNVIFYEKLDADGGNTKLEDKSITKIIFVCLKMIFVIFIELDIHNPDDIHGYVRHQ